MRIVMNLVAPMCWVRATGAAGQGDFVPDRIEQRIFAWSSGHDLTTARDRPVLVGIMKTTSAAVLLSVNDLDLLAELDARTSIVSSDRSESGSSSPPAPSAS